MACMSAFDVRVLGSGIVSRCVALVLAQQGLRIALQAKPAAAGLGAPSQVDVRAYALNPASVALLQRLKVWEALPLDARTTVLDMDVHGDALGGHIAFSAWDHATEALAWIVDAAALESVLDTAASFAASVTVQPEPAAAALTVVAEGKASAQRAALGAQMQRHPYGHWALAARLVSEQPHCGTARQWFRSPDILALLPFDRPEPQQSWGLVWSQPEAQAKDMLAWPVEQFEAALLEASQGAVGALRLASERALWPLAIAQAEPVVGPGWALVGDAAHVVHPLAGQGLNLGLADVLALDEVMAQREAWRELGDPALLARYARKRRLGTLAMAGGTDALWHLFASEAPGLRELRNHGMSLVDRVAPLKRWLMGRAMSV